MTTIILQQEMNALCCADCGIQFAITKDFEARRRADHRTFCCPVGHSNAYQAESDRDKVARLARELAHSQELLRSTQAAKDEMQKTMRRMKKRVGKGVCPCCNRTFLELGRHMKTKHPEFSS